MKTSIWILLFFLGFSYVSYAQTSPIETPVDTNQVFAPPPINTIILVQIYARDLPLMIRKNLQEKALDFPEIEAVYEVYDRESRQLLYYGMNLLSPNHERVYLRYSLDGKIIPHKPQ